MVFILILTKNTENYHTKNKKILIKNHDKNHEKSLHNLKFIFKVEIDSLKYSS